MYNDLRTTDPNKLSDRQKKLLDKLERQYQRLKKEADELYPNVGGNSSATSYTDTMRTANPLRYLGQE